MRYQLNTLKFVLFCLLFTGCNTQSGKVEFPILETEFRQPKLVKATPTFKQVPNALPNAKYTTDKGQLVERDQSIPLKIAIPKKAGTPKITESRLRKRQIPANLTKRPAGIPKKTKANGKTVPAKGKVIMAGKPQSKPYMPPVARDDDHYGFRNIGQNQNLPGTIVYTLLEDSQGRIWVATDNGLVMLEGEEMKIYTTKEGLSSNSAFSLLESSTGAIWIGTAGGGIDVFEDGLFTHYGTEEGLSNNIIYSLLKTSTGAIWIGNEGGIDVFEDGTFTHYGREEGLIGNKITSLLESSTGAIWMGTPTGVDVFEEGTFAHYGKEEGLSSTRVTSLLEPSAGIIWIGTQGGIDVLEEGSFTHYGTEEGLSSNAINDLSKSSTGAIWISNEGGIDVLEEGSFTHYSTEEGLSSNRAYRLLESSTGDIWIGTYGEGLDFFKPGRFTHYGTKEGLMGNGVLNLLESSNGAIWVGTYGGGLNIFEQGRFTHYGTEEGLSNPSIFSVLESSTGAIWIGTYGGGVNVFEEGSFTHYGLEEGLSSSIVLSMLESSTGAIWIGTLGGVNVFEDGKFTHYGTEEGLSSERVYSLLESSTGAIWIGTAENGVDVFEEGRFAHYSIEEGLSGNAVRSLAESPTGAIWIGTYGGGVSVFEDGNFTHYGTEEGLADNAVQQLAVDDLGNIWAGTGKGVTRFVANENGGYELTSWNKTHGFKYMDFNGPGSPMLFTKTDKASEKGTMWSGIGQVLTAFKPSTDMGKPSLFLTAVDIGLKPVDWSKASNAKSKMKGMKGINADTLFFPNTDSLLLLSNFPPDTNSLTQAGIRWKGTESLSPYHLPKKLELPFDQNHITFHYSGMKLSEQSDIVYRYILEGMDKEWSPITKEGKEDYRNIPPGNYTFRVKARGRNFVWSDEASISFVVHSPWWLTWWAYAIYTVMAVALILFAFKLNTRRLVQQKRQLEQIVDERTREVREQSEEIKAQSEELQQNNEELSTTLDVVYEQKEEIEKWKTNTQASITYAARIQSAILPLSEEIKNDLPQNFVLFKPRDTVSGDFYWFEKINQKLVLAAADCTGHGVPGAFMSMLGSQGLMEVVGREKIDNPGEVLRKLDLVIRQSLKQKENGSRDGMDIGLVVIDKENQTMEFAGAKNPIFYIQNQKMNVIKGSKFSIGGFHQYGERTYETHQIDISIPTVFYLFTDGFQDQFGGPEDRKFMVKYFRDLLFEIHQKPMEEQKEILDTKIEEWMAASNEKQTDDICVLGVRF